MAGPKPAALPLGYAPTICTLDNIAATARLVSSTWREKLELFALLYSQIASTLNKFNSAWYKADGSHH